MNLNINEQMQSLMNNMAQMVTSQFVEIAQQYVKSGALNQCFKQMLGQQMMSLKPQPIIIDDYVKLEEEQQSQAQVQFKETKKEKKQTKAQRKIKLLLNEKVNISQNEEEKSEKEKSEKIRQKQIKNNNKQLEKKNKKSQKIRILNQNKRPLSNYNVYFRERNKSLKNLSFQEKAVMISKEWRSMTAEEKGLYSDKPNIDLSSILNQTREFTRGNQQDEVIPTALRTEQKQIVNNVKSEHIEPLKIVQRNEKDKQLL